MIRTQIQLEPEQYDRLRKLAAARQQSLAQLVREGVDHLLAESERSARWDALWRAAGACHDAEGRTDVSVNHDVVLADNYRP
ncbi:MAG: ribbon-helix-helix protein, CopG family [Acidobacteriota bacterium]